MIGIISIHVPLAGNVSGRAGSIALRASISIHVPLAGNVDHLSEFYFLGDGFLSTFPLRGTSVAVQLSSGGVLISIHVPLAGNVFGVWHHRPGDADISIHVPLAGNVTMYSMS